jgi:hypothetical protein
LVTVTFSPVWLAVPFQAFVMCWSPGKVNFSVQPDSGADPVSKFFYVADMGKRPSATRGHVKRR